MVVSAGGVVVCCGVALVAVVPIHRVPMATPAGRLLFRALTHVVVGAGAACGGRVGEQT